MDNLEQNQPTSTPQVNGGFSLKGVVDVLYQPAKLFEKMKESPKVLVPWLVFFVLIFGFFLIAGDLIAEFQMEAMQERLADQGVQNSQNMPSLSQMKWSTVIFGTVFLMLSPLLASALALFFGNVVMAGKAGFKQILSVMLYGEIIYGLGALIIAPLMLAKGSMKVSLSLAALLNHLSIDDPLYLAASKVGVFYIWEIIAIGIGLSIIYSFPRNKGYVLAVLSMGMISILHVLSQFVFGSM